jgi:hypothetical protein
LVRAFFNLQKRETPRGGVSLGGLSGVLARFGMRTFIPWRGYDPASTERAQKVCVCLRQFGNISGLVTNPGVDPVFLKAK